MDALTRVAAGGTGRAWFSRATFTADASFDQVKVLHLDDPHVTRSWPSGWTVRPDPDDPSRGTLTRDAAEPP